MTFTQNAVAEALHKAVQTKGEDYVYERPRRDTSGCFYTTPDGSPSCIVGWVVNALEPELLDRVAEFERETDSSFGAQYLVSGNFRNIASWHQAKAAKVGKFDIPETVAIALQAAQGVQDEGGTWGQAEAAFNIVMAGDFPEGVGPMDYAEYAQVISRGDEWLY